MADFLQSKVFVGEDIPKHEHKRLIVILVIIVVIAIIIGAVFWLKSSNFINSNVPPSGDDNSVPDVAELNKSIVSVPEKESTSLINNLNKSIKPAPQKTSDDIIKQLNSSIK